MVYNYFLDCVFRRIFLENFILCDIQQLLLENVLIGCICPKSLYIFAALKINKMRKILVFTLCLCFVTISTTVKSQQEMTKENMTELQRTSYALGANAGESFASSGINIDFDAFIAGLQDAMKGENKFNMQEMQHAFEILNKQVQANQQKKQEEAAAAAEVEKEIGKQFLAENKKKEGVVETASGLQYKVVKMGNGAKPTATDQVKVHYHGTTIDGTVFDSSVERGEPITFPLNGVIAGWTEGVQLMPIGSKFIFYIPSDLAYGDRGAGAVIKPGATLIFEVELLEINPK